MQEFERLFAAVTGYEPLHWQRRLFRRFYHNRIPKVVDLPTGMGKTSVIGLWVLALRLQIAEEQNPRLPTRLLYVVDRRTVVDQATALAERIASNVELLHPRQDWPSVRRTGRISWTN